MAFTDSEKAQIRKWLGFPALFHYRDPRLESAIAAVESIADGGATEALVRTHLQKLASIEDAIDQVAACMGTVQVGKVQTDAARAQLMHERRGRRYIGYLSDAIGLGGYVMRDVFTAPQVQPSGDEIVRARPNGGWP